MANSKKRVKKPARERPRKRWVVVTHAGIRIASSPYDSREEAEQVALDMQLRAMDFQAPTPLIDVQPHEED